MLRQASREGRSFVRNGELQLWEGGEAAAASPSFVVAADMGHSPPANTACAAARAIPGSAA